MMRFARAKRVTDPLGDEVRALLVGTRAGSEHSVDDVDDAPCLFELVQGFLEEGSVDAEPRAYEYDSESDSGSDSERAGLVVDCTDAAEEIVTTLRNCLRADSYGSLLLVHVVKAMECFSSVRGSDHHKRAVFRREVASFLRDLGHNAATCKTKWNSSGGLTAGSYEFIDVLALIGQSSGATCQTVRYIVDLEFASQFEIARPTCQYSRVIESLPVVFVGKPDDLKRIVRLTCDAARRSLKSRGLTLPPWRKNRYMQTRWSGPYKRSTNLTPSSASVNTIKCRAVGFEDAVAGRPYVRTR